MSQRLPPDTLDPRLHAAHGDVFPVGAFPDAPEPPRRPRVLFLNHAGVTGGAELVLLDIARAHAATGTVALLEEGPFRARLEQAGVDVRVIEGAGLHSVRRGSAAPSVGAVASVVRTARTIATLARAYDVIYANTQKAFVVACVAGTLARRPVIWHLHDIFGTEHFSRANTRLGIGLGNRIAARVIAVSQATADAFVAHGGRADKVHVVHNGIDPAPFRSLDAAGVAAGREALGWRSTPVVGCFSRLAPWKGQHVLLEALPHLPGVRAVFVGGALFGEQAYADALLTRAAELGVADRVEFLGARDDVARLMQLVDVIAHTSVAPEPFARVVMDAMLAGRPLVATATGGTPEIVQDGVSGVLFAPGDARGLASRAARVLGEPAYAVRIAAAGRERATAHFTLDAMLDAVRRHIEEVARR